MHTEVVRLPFWQYMQGLAPVVLCELMGRFGISDFAAPDSATFRTMDAGCCFPALFKLSKGWLFPMPSALVFVGVLNLQSEQQVLHLDLSLAVILIFHT